MVLTSKCRETGDVMSCHVSPLNLHHLHDVRCIRTGLPAINLWTLLRASLVNSISIKQESRGSYLTFRTGIPPTCRFMHHEWQHACCTWPRVKIWKIFFAVCPNCFSSPPIGSLASWDFRSEQMYKLLSISCCQCAWLCHISTVLTQLLWRSQETFPAV